jgi:hypothetical protein
VQGLSISFPGRQEIPPTDRRRNGQTPTQSLAAAEQVGPDIFVLDRKPATGPAEPSENLVGDQKHFVLVAKPTQLSEPSGWRQQNSFPSGDGLDDDTGHPGSAAQAVVDLARWAPEGETINVAVQESHEWTPEGRA